MSVVHSFEGQLLAQASNRALMQNKPDNISVVILTLGIEEKHKV